jgi:prepilin peptidase CpaA
MSLPLVVDLLLLTYCFGVMYTDLREQRIYNSWTFSFMGVGLLLAGAGGGETALIAAGQGMALGFLALFPFYALGGIGAGDVKMLMAVGALKGWKFLLSTCLWGALAGGVLSFLVMFYDSRRFGGVMSYLTLMKTEIQEGTARQESVRTKMAYGVAIAVGVLVARYYPVSF